MLSGARRQLFKHKMGSGGGIVLGPNVLPTPNGPYTSGSWGATNVTETTGQTDPLGGSTASLLSDGIVAGQHYVSPGQTFAVVNGQKYLMSMYVKSGSFTGDVCLRYGGMAVVNFNLTSHTGANGSGGTVTPTNISMTLAGNGFYLCRYNFVADASVSTQWYCGYTADLGAYTGSNQTFTLWGAALQTST